MAAPDVAWIREQLQMARGWGYAPVSPETVLALCDENERLREALTRPLIRDSAGTIRFKANVLVCRLYDVASKHGLGLNELILEAIRYGKYPSEDYEELMQLIGYSVSGYCELSGVSDTSKDAASAAAEGERRRPVWVDRANEAMDEADRLREALDNALAREQWAREKVDRIDQALTLVQEHLDATIAALARAEEVVRG